MLMRPASLFAALFLCAPVLAAAPAKPPRPALLSDHDLGKTCAAPVFRQFDFWLGRWHVTNPAGVTVGHSRITRISRGCAIREQWFGRKSTGNSLNYYDAGTKQWHQDWVGSGGQVLHLHGRLQGASMVLTGTRKDKRGHVRDRITWTPLNSGRVRQHWEISRDSGTSWKTIFLGTYTRATTNGTL
ncbi:hypothetical protein GCM10027285_18160 [Oleiagrimonas citrea]